MRLAKGTVVIAGGKQGTVISFHEGVVMPYGVVDRYLINFGSYDQFHDAARVVLPTQRELGL